MPHAIRVIIVEREPLYRRGLVGCLQADPRFVVVGAVGTSVEGYQLVEDASPDVALVGTTLIGTPDLAFATELRHYHPAVAVIVVAATESDAELFAAIRAGASAYVGRDIGEDVLYELIERSSHGEYIINEQLLNKPFVAERVLDQFRRNTRSDPALSNAFMPLTERELEILRKVSDGMTNAQIGYALGISGQTVKNHVTSILRKLAVNDRTQAVVTALKRGWLTIEGYAVVSNIDELRRPNPDRGEHPQGVGA
jgi:DNA-binding NarL/FixJ family response regulator